MQEKITWETNFWLTALMYRIDCAFLSDNDLDSTRIYLAQADYAMHLWAMHRINCNGERVPRLKINFYTGARRILANLKKTSYTILKEYKNEP